MSFISPKFLQKGDTVAVLATARAVNKKAVEQSLEVLESWGLIVVQGDCLYNQHQLFAGTDSERCQDLQRALNDTNIRAIFCARGGYGTTRIIDNIDWSHFKNYPKWICGFSDVTALLNHVHNLGISSIHATMPQLFSKVQDGDDLKSLQAILFGEEPLKLAAKYNHYNHIGKSQGVMVGGNLSLLVHGIGTPSEIDTNDKILFLEEVDEYLYEIDRMMVQLKRSGKLSNINGLVVGHLTKMKEGDLSFGTGACGVIRSHVQNEIPIAFDFPFGHDNPNLAIPLGMKGNLLVSPEMIELTF